MSNKCKVISFGEINKYYFLIIVEVIIGIIISLIENETKSFSDEIKHPVINHIIYSISLCL